MAVTAPAREASTTTWCVATPLGHCEKYYGDANKYPRIFEANRPMLSHPDKIYGPEAAHPGAVGPACRRDHPCRQGRPRSATRPAGRDALCWSGSPSKPSRTFQASSPRGWWHAAPPPRNAHRFAAQQHGRGRGAAARICASKPGSSPFRAIASRPRPRRRALAHPGALGVAAHIDQHRIARLRPLPGPHGRHITGIALVGAPHWLSGGSGVVAQA